MIVEYKNEDWDTVAVDVTTAELSEVNNAYSYLLDLSHTDAFPGSKAWKSSQVFAAQLQDLIKARPEIEQYRRDIAAAKRASRLNGIDIAGV